VRVNCFGIDALSGVAVEIEFDETIREVRPARETPGVYLAPGWIDIQVNGFAGVDFNCPDVEHGEIARAVRRQIADGVTRLYPTVITGAPNDMRKALCNLSRAKDSIAEGAAIDGFHVEGPHIGSEDGPRGAHPKRWVRKPDFDEYRSWQDATDGRVRIVTISPEWPEAPAYMERVVADGVVASIGHTGANAQQIADAVSAGASLSTHLGNGAHAMMRRHPNYIWDQLAEDRLMADFIVDGIHVGDAFLKTAVRAKGVERSVLVTDASAPAGAKPGRYYLGEQPVDLTEDDRVVLAGTEKLAGSALHMHRAIINVMRMAGVSLADAVRMATVNAAAAGNVPGRKLGLAPGERADVVQFTIEANQLQIQSVWIGGVQQAIPQAY
jgi:N-acetylglucosamine-6-phosphate deacetylase